MRFLFAALLLLSTSALRAANEDAPVLNAEETAKREFQQGNLDAALKSLSEVEKRGEPSAKVLVLKGRIFAEQHKTDEAVAIFDKAYSLDPSSFARLYLADMFLEQKRWDEARAMYEAAMKETKVLISNERLRYGVLIAALGAKNDEAARTAFESISFPTESPAYYYAQAAWGFSHGLKTDADKWIRRAEEVYPVKSTAWFARPLYEMGWVKTKPPLIAD